MYAQHLHVEQGSDALIYTTFSLGIFGSIWNKIWNSCLVLQLNENGFINNKDAFRSDKLRCAINFCAN